MPHVLAGAAAEGAGPGEEVRCKRHTDWLTEREAKREAERSEGIERKTERGLTGVEKISERDAEREARR